MFNPFEDEYDDDEGTVFRDVIFLALAGFVMFVLLLLPHLNPPARKLLEEAKSPGNLIIEISWQKDLDADVDLWVQAPGHSPVGYSNKGGQIFNLLRDDLGGLGDVTDINYEVAYSRGIISGEYVVNLHLYRNNTDVYPIEVQVVASIKKKASDAAKAILKRQVVLEHHGHEITVFRFRLNEDGDIIQGSVHDIPKAIRKIPKR